MNQLQHYFLRFNHRQQLLLATGLLLGLVYVFYFWLWVSIAEQKKQLEVQYQLIQKSLDSVKILAREYRTLRKSETDATSSGRINLSKVADSTAVKNQVQIKRYQPSANGGAQLRFENVGFEQVLGWLYDIETYHKVSLQDISITQGHDSGLVNVSVRLLRL